MIGLSYEDSGEGVPVVCIHGAFIADAFRPLRSEPALAERYRLITYRRRGYSGSSGTPPTSLAGQAADCRELFDHLGLRRAHVVGHSLGGAIALRLALEAPQLVHTLTVLEPGVLIGERAASYRAALEHSVDRFRSVGALVAVDEFLELRWPRYGEHLDRILPGAFDQAVRDAGTSFEADLPSALDAHFDESDAGRIEQPALVLLGERSVALDPRFEETFRLLLDWLPNAEGVVVPGAAHLMQLERPGAVAEALAAFFARHPLRDG